MSIAPQTWLQLLELAEQAQDVSHDQLDAWLAQQELASETLDLLKQLLADRRAVETSAFLQALPATTREPTAARAWWTAGQVIDHWRLVRELGQGGMSSVWLAEPLHDGPQRQVALKLPHTGPGQDVLAARLLRERTILASLEHPHIARLYDVGVSDSGLPYLVMEVVNGATLLEHANNHQMDLPSRVRLFQQVLQAVQHAHSKLVLHRDIKPGNILVNEQGDVKLLDFGIAKPLHPDLHLTQLTQAAGRQLTPSYASPEQLRNEELTTTSDVYALGVLLCELLTGLRPLDDAYLLLCSQDQAEHRQHLHTPSELDVSAPSSESRGGLSPAALRKSLRGDLDAICHKATAFDPQRRYPSAEAFSADLTRWLRGEPVTARAPNPWYALSKFIRRHLLATSLAACSLILVVAGGVAATWMGVKLQREAKRSERAYTFMAEMFEDADPTHDLTASELLLRSMERLQKPEHSDDPRLTAQLLEHIAEGLHSARQFEAANEARHRLIMTLDRIPDLPASLNARFELIRNHLLMGNVPEAAKMLEEAAQKMPRSADHVDLQRSVALSAAEVAFNANQYAVADQAFTLFFSLSEAGAVPIHPNDETLARGVWAVTLAHLGQVDRAQDELRKGLAYAETVDPGVAQPQVLKLLLTRLNWQLLFEQGDMPQLLEVLASTLQACDRRADQDKEHGCLVARATAISAELHRGQRAAAMSLAFGHRPRAQLNLNYPKDATVLASFLSASTRDDGLALMAAFLRQDLQTLKPRSQLILRQALAESWLRWGDRVAAQQHLPALLALRQQPFAVRDERQLFRLLVLIDLLADPNVPANARLARLGPVCRETLPNTSKIQQPFLHQMRLHCVRPLVQTAQADRAQALVEAAQLNLASHFGADTPASLQAQALASQLKRGQLPASPALF